MNTRKLLVGAAFVAAIVLSAAFLVLSGGLVRAQGLWPTEEGEEICLRCMEIPPEVVFPSGTGVWSNASYVCNLTDQLVTVWIRPWIQEPEGHHGPVALLVLEAGQCLDLERVEGFECSTRPTGSEAWNDRVKGLCWPIGANGPVVFYENDRPDPAESWTFQLPGPTATPTSTFPSTNTPTPPPTSTSTPTATTTSTCPCNHGTFLPLLFKNY